VTILKPVCGLEKDQKTNLRTACLQDYPEFQVVYSVQDPGDSALPLLKEIQEEFGPDRVSVAVEDRQAGPNGKINNLLGALAHARYDLLVVSDSDACLKPDYLKTIVSPLADPEVGLACTFYRATSADRWFEKMELLTFNAEFIPSVIFALVTGASKFCLGPSIAFRRSLLKDWGGLETFADYLVEDYEMGRRTWSSGKKVEVAPYFIEMVVNVTSPSQWWHHQLYWDQNTRAARPAGFLASVLTRSVPFSLLFAASRGGDLLGSSVLGIALGLRLATAAAILRWGLRDAEGMKGLPLLPLRDIVGLASWFLALTRRKVIWRGKEFIVTRQGRLLPTGTES
jgi:ceramide glucosyltransferase